MVEVKNKNRIMHLHLWKVEPFSYFGAIAFMFLGVIICILKIHPLTWEGIAFLVTRSAHIKSFHKVV